MRLVLTLLTIFTLSLSSAQEISLVRPIKVAPRSEIIPYPTADEALYGSRDTSLYYTPIREWRVEAGTLSSDFLIPFDWVNRNVLLRIGAAREPYTVELNGREVIHEVDSNSPADINITDFVRDEINTLTLRLSPSAEVEPIEGWSGAMEELVRDVAIRSQPLLMLEDIFTTTTRHGARIAIAFRSNMLNTRTSRLNYTLLHPNGELAREGSSDVEIKMRGGDTIYISLPLDGVELWSADNPQKYRLSLSMQEGGRFTEYHSYELGFKLVELKGGELKINGEREPLTAARVPVTITEREIDALRDSLEINTLLLGAGKFNREIYEYCDREGIYLIPTAPINSSHSGSDIKAGGNPTNDPSFVEHYVSRALGSYFTTRGYSSVIAFSLADHSLNGYNLYESYLALKGIEEQLPIIYPEAGGEWNSDKLKF